MTTPPAGQMPWEEAVAGPLAGATCLWQDLDGLHVEPAPVVPPPTSVIWGWRGDVCLVRVRLDGGNAFVAVCEPAGAAGQAPTATATLPWSPSDGPVAASRGRGPGPADGGVGAAYEQVVVDGPGDGTGPVTFLRPAMRRAGDPDRHA